MSRAAVQLKVGGQTYRVVTSATEDDLQRLAETVEDRMLARETADRVRERIDALPEAQRQVVVLRDVQGLSAAEASGVIRIISSPRILTLDNREARISLLSDWANLEQTEFDSRDRAADLYRRILEVEDYTGEDLLAPTRLYLDEIRRLGAIADVRGPGCAAATGAGISGIGAVPHGGARERRPLRAAARRRSPARQQ